MQQIGPSITGDGPTYSGVSNHVQEGQLHKGDPSTVFEGVRRSYA